MSALTITRELQARPERVWTAWTTNEYARWIWPPSFGTLARIDPRPGGEFWIRSEVADMGVDGVFQEVTPSRRLVLTWRWHDETETTLVTLELEPSDRGTILELRHDLFPDDESRDAHVQGWNDCLDRLPAFLAT